MNEHARRYARGARDALAREGWRRHRRDQRIANVSALLQARRNEERPIGDPRSFTAEIATAHGTMLTTDRYLAAALMVQLWREGA